MKKDNRSFAPKVRGDERSHGAMLDKINWTHDLKRVRQAGPKFSNDSSNCIGNSTKSVHSGSFDDKTTGAVGTPIYQTSTFLLDKDQYDSVEQGHARDRFIYSRYGNPNQWVVQEKIAALENAESALVFSSGMAAITASVMALLDKGAHVVASNELYGGTYALFNNDFPTWGMSVSYVDPNDFDAIEAAIKPSTQLMYFEALTNPLLKLSNLKKLVAIAKKHRLRMIVDATFVTPISCRPLDWGVDLVVHSASKYLNGHSDLIAGVVVGSRKLVDLVWPKLLNYGGCMDPHACYLLERGLKTLAIRMKAHEQTALALAQYLETHPQIKKVIYPLLASYQQFELAQQQLELGGGMITLEVVGGDKAALQLLQHLKFVKSATSLGGVESLISLPFNTSQAAFTSKQRESLGINPGCVRLSVGIEDAIDLIADFEQALKKITKLGAIDEK